MPVSRRLKLSPESSDDEDSSSVENIPLRTTRSSKEPQRRSTRQAPSPKPTKRKAPVSRKSKRVDTEDEEDEDEDEEEYVESSHSSGDESSDAVSSDTEEVASSQQSTATSSSSASGRLPCSSLTCLYKSKTALRKDMLVCAYQPCSKAAHPPCLGFSPQLIKVVRSQSEWLCHDCKICAVCMKPAGEVRLTLLISILFAHRYPDDLLHRVRPGSSSRLLSTCPQSPTSGQVVVRIINRRMRC